MSDEESVVSKRLSVGIYRYSVGKIQINPIKSNVRRGTWGIKKIENANLPI